MSYSQAVHQLAAQSCGQASEDRSSGESLIADAQHVDIKVLRTYEQLENIRPVWTAWQQHPNADMDFYLRTMRSLPGVIRPHVLVLYRGGTPRAMLIGRLERGVVKAAIGYRSVIKASARLMTFIHGGFLGSVPPQDAEMLVKKVLSLLKIGEADAAYFNHLDTHSAIYEGAVRLPGMLVRDHVPSISTHWKMVLPKFDSDIYQSLRSKHRKTLKWQIKKVKEQLGAALSIRHFNSSEDLDGMFQDVEKIAQKTYQRGLGVGFRDSSEMRDRMRFAAEKNWLRAYVLYVYDSPVAFWIGTLYRDVLHSDFMGYDPAYSKHSPGMFLVVEVIEEMCHSSERDGVEAIDFGLGDAQYKATLANNQWFDGSLFVFAPSLRGIGLNALRTPALLLNRVAVRAINRLGVATRIKKLWRDFVIPP